jgi:hypothetical protein
MRSVLFRFMGQVRVPTSCQRPMSDVNADGFLGGQIPFGVASSRHLKGPGQLRHIQAELEQQRDL